MKNPFRYLMMLGIAGFLMPMTACGQAKDKAYRAMLSSMYEHTVPLIKADSLQELLHNNSAIMLDTRSRREYEVSHISNARYTGYEDFDIAQVRDIPKDTTIVLYCSVGYRSERIGEKLKEEGFKNIYNLYGGMFQWVNKGYPVVNTQGDTTEKVHAYNKKWGVWLRKGEKVYE